MYLLQVSSRGHRTHEPYESALNALPLSYHKYVYCAVVSLEKVLKAIIPTSGGSAQ